MASKRSSKRWTERLVPMSWDMLYSRQVAAFFWALIILGLIFLPQIWSWIVREWGW